MPTLQEQIDFIIGPQAPTGSYFDSTLVTKAKLHGEAAPAVPPADPDAQTITVGNLTASFNNHFYYDLPFTEYVAHARTGDTLFQAIARKCADSWWQHPQWIGSGKIRKFPDEATPSPRHAGIGGLICRAMDGRPEMWDWINAYTRAAFNTWIMTRIPKPDAINPQLHYGLREGGFVLRFAAWLTKALPDSFPLQAGGVATNGAQLRAQYLADIENACVNYFGRLQYQDGSWRWGSGIDEYGDSKLTLATVSPVGSGSLSTVNGVPEAIPAGELIWFPNQEVMTRTTAPVPVGSKSILVEQRFEDGWVPLRRDLPKDAVGQYAPLQGITQPFMVGLLLRALCDAHQVVSSDLARTSIKIQILNGCRHLYSDGPYSRAIATNFGVETRGFHYFYHGGTSVNPTRYVRGDIPSPWLTTERWHVESARQAISTIAGSFAYAYKISGDEFFKTAGNELYDSAYGGRDGFRAMMADTAKNFNQHVFGSSSFTAWLGGAVTPAPLPAPAPAPTPTPPPEPSVPVVTLNLPLDGSTLSGTVTVTATVTDSGTINIAYLIVDDVVINSDSVAPYSFSVDTTKLNDGNHSLFVRAWNAAGKAGDSKKISVVVANTTPAPTPTPTPVPVPTPPATRSVTWPKQLSKQNPIIEAQWKEKFRLKSVGDGSAVFEKVG